MAANQCPECGHAAFGERIEPLTVEHNGQSRTIRDRGTVCGNCGHVGYVGSQISGHELAVAAVIRDIEGLLSAEELQRIRLKYRFRQTDMEQMLSTGPKTWTRWERGKVPQSKAADKLIRLLGEDPDVARRLMEQANIDNPDAAAVFRQIEDDARHLGRLLMRAEWRSLQEGDPDGFVDRLADRAFDAARDIRRRAMSDATAADSRQAV